MVTLFPEPDSPTIPRTSPSSSVNEIPSTARTIPSSVRKETLRSRTRAEAQPSGEANPWIEPGVDKVDKSARQRDEEGRVDDGRHDHGQVEGGERVVGQQPDPR